MPKVDDNTDDDLLEIGFQFAQAAAEIPDGSEEKAVPATFALILQEIVALRQRVANLDDLMGAPGK